MYAAHVEGRLTCGSRHVEGLVQSVSCGFSRARGHLRALGTVQAIDDRRAAGDDSRDAVGKPGPADFCRRPLGWTTSLEEPGWCSSAWGAVSVRPGRPGEAQMVRPEIQCVTALRSDFGRGNSYS